MRKEIPPKLHMIYNVVQRGFLTYLSAGCVFFTGLPEKWLSGSVQSRLYLMKDGKEGGMSFIWKVCVLLSGINYETVSDFTKFCISGNNTFMTGFIKKSDFYFFTGLLETASDLLLRSSFIPFVMMWYSSIRSLRCCLPSSVMW